jgi:hypothetical protein
METIPDLLRRVRFAKIGAAVALTSVAAFLLLALAYPEPISSEALGAEWHCTRTAFIWTSCTRARLAEPVLQSAGRNKVSERAGGKEWYQQDGHTELCAGRCQG